jgi:hypothetical protein
MTLKNYSKSILLNLIACLVILFFIKFYVFSILLCLLVPFKYNLVKNFKHKFVPYILILSLFCLLAILLNPKINLLNLIDKKQESFISETKYKNSGSYFEITNIEPNLESIIKVIPEAIFNSLTRPLPWNVNSLIQLPAVLENILLLALIVLAFLDLYRKKMLRKIDVNFVLFCSIFVFLNYVIIGIITPVSGALVRYKMIALPFLIMLILLTVNLNRFKMKKS